MWCLTLMLRCAFRHFCHIVKFHNVEIFLHTHTSVYSSFNLWNRSTKLNSAGSHIKIWDYRKKHTEFYLKDVVFTVILGVHCTPSDITSLWKDFLPEIVTGWREWCILNKLLLLRRLRDKVLLLHLLICNPFSFAHWFYNMGLFPENFTNWMFHTLVPLKPFFKGEVPRHYYSRTA